MKRWPWLTMTVAAALALSPLGQEFIYGAFFSNEQLSRNIAQPIVATGVVVLVVLGGVEYLIGTLICRRRAQNTES